MMIEYGYIDEVRKTFQGSALVADAAVGATTLLVGDTADFTGGALSVNDDLYEYTAVDRAANTLTLPSPGLLAAALEDDPVYTVPTSITYIATVSIADADDPISARVPFSMASTLPEGMRDNALREVVSVELVDGEWRVRDLLGEGTGLVVADAIDPDTIPPAPTDGVPPLNSPTPTVEPGIRSLFVSWTAVPNDDLVTYQVFASTSTPVLPVAGNLVGSVVGGTLCYFEALANGSVLVPGTTYYVAIMASDVDGAAALSIEATGVPEQAADPAVLAQHTQDIADLNVDLAAAEADLDQHEIDIASLEGLFPITTTSITDGAITTPKMTANTINGDRILANSLNAAKIVAGTITTDRMTANTINGDRILANTLDAAKIVAGSITTDRMTANTINGDRILTNTLNANRIVAGTISATQLTATAIDGFTITGATVRTSSSGNRMQMRDDGAGGVLEMFTGIAGETAGSVDAFLDSGQPGLRLAPPFSTTYTDWPELLLISTTAGNNSVIYLGAEAVTLTGQVTCTGAAGLRVSAGPLDILAGITGMGRTMDAWDFGNKTGNTDGSGLITVSGHNAGAADVVFLTGNSNAGRAYTVTTKSSGQFTVRVTNAAGNDVTNAAVDFFWLALRA